jgi:hypothetical protein
VYLRSMEGLEHRCLENKQRSRWFAANCVTAVNQMRKRAITRKFKRNEIMATSSAMDFDHQAHIWYTWINRTSSDAKRLVQAKLADVYHQNGQVDDVQEVRHA